jgi:WD40-like Beta Propeller Repeat
VPAAITDRPPPAAHAFGHSRRARPWLLVDWVALAALLLALLSPAAALAHPPGITERVSVSSVGTEGNNDSTGPSISADGRLVAFTSDADNLVAGDGKFDVDVFVRDRQAQTTVPASLATDGTQTGFELGSGNASLSADGQGWPSSRRGRWPLRTAAFRWTSSCTTSSRSGRAT